MSNKQIEQAEAVKMIQQHEGEIFGVEFLRAKPKCPECGKTHEPSELMGDLHCPAPKCKNEKCVSYGKTFGKRVAKQGVCPDCGYDLGVCGVVLETMRKMNGRLGVTNPGEGVTKPGTGTRSAMGGFKERLMDYGIVTVYDMDKADERSDGKRGAYRSFKVGNLLSLNLHHERFKVK